MIEEELKAYKKAGKVANLALLHGASLIKEGESVAKILDEVENFIIKNDCEVAFPAQISINNIAAHQCSDDYEEIIPKGLIKLDVGAHYKGFIGDNAKTIAVGVDDSLIKASDEALANALKIIKPGVKVKDIGKVIESTITSFGFTPVKNLSGHGVDFFKVHTKPSIPNFEAEIEDTLVENQVIAIEPFASKGIGLVSAKGNATVFSLKDEKPVRSQITRQILNEIKTYKGLPFTSRWLNKKFGVGKTNFALRELKQKNMLEEYPALQDHDLVSQSEHTVSVKEKSIITTRDY